MRSFSLKMLKCGIAACLFGVAAAALAADSEPGFFDRVEQRLTSTWKEGQTEVYVPLYTYHMRFAYSQESIDGYQEHPYGLGLGRGRYDEKGDWHGLYVMGFQDSHFKPQYMAGYGYKTFWPLGGDVKAGLGYTVFLAFRSDIGHYAPIPGILPVASLEYKKISLDASYIPGGKGNGNVLFIWSKIHF